MLRQSLGGAVILFSLQRFKTPALESLLVLLQNFRVLLENFQVMPEINIILLHP